MKMDEWDTKLRKKIEDTGVAYAKVKARPNAPATKIVDVLTDTDGSPVLKMNVHAVPEKGKANAEIEKFLKKKMKPLRIEATIVGGQKGRTKLVKLVVVE
jgi:uncharacterized protein YggU (UPF0235/DUF167 family)